MNYIFNRGYNLSSLEKDLNSDFCNVFGYNLDYRKNKNINSVDYHKTLCNHKKKLNKKLNNKK